MADLSALGRNMTSLGVPRPGVANAHTAANEAVTPHRSGSASPYVGQAALQNRPDVSAALHQHVQARLLRLRLLAESARKDQQAAQAGVSHPVPASSFLQGMKAQLRGFFEQSDHTVRLAVQIPGAAFWPASRFQQATRLLSDVFGLSQTEIRQAVQGIMGQFDRDGGAGQGFGGQGGGQGGNQGSGQGADQQPAELLKDYLFLEVAKGGDAGVLGMTVEPARLAQIDARQARLFQANAHALQACESVALLALTQAADGAPLRTTGAAQRWDGTLHEACDQLLRLSTPDTIFQCLHSLLNSPDVVGQSRRNTTSQGVSARLNAIRNLCVISLVMDKVESLLTGMLRSGVDKAQVPSTTDTLRAVCAVPKVVDHSPIKDLCSKTGLSGWHLNSFINQVFTILRDLPVAAWSEPDERARALLSLGGLAQSVAMPPVKVNPAERSAPGQATVAATP